MRQKQKSRERLKQLLELTDRDIDDRLEALVWALRHNPDPDVPVVAQVENRNLWVARTDYPHLRIYLRPRAEVEGECEWLWIEEAD